MELPFANRVAELAELDSAVRSGGLVVVFGRRRVGKSRLLGRWLERHSGLYSQAIEAAKEIQIEQAFGDVRDSLATSITPKTWTEFLELFGFRKGPSILCLDEFPYLVASDPSLPSVLQKWIDHAMPPKCLLILSGSSTRMMNGLFLNRSAPLYGRARKLLHVRPMGYGAFCAACRLPPADTDSFVRFSLVGGIPKYWEFVERDASPLDLADQLFFGFAPYLDQEPARILRDEGISGLTALSVLEAIGRGAEKPSEIASRLGTVQTNLSRPLQQLLDASVLDRQLPFGESLRTTKRILYRIQDPALRFWFRVYSPHRTRWHRYSPREKAALLRDHASTVFADLCREQHPEAARYWEARAEFAFVRPGPGRSVIVSEVKFKPLPPQEKLRLECQLAEVWKSSTLATRHTAAAFEIVDPTVLPDLAAATS